MDQWVTEAEYRLHRIAKNTSGQYLSDGADDGVLRDVAVLILIDQQARICRGYGVPDVTGL
ncbi:hypothetical protein D3C87_1888420 [compost metagenome]